MSPTDPNQLAAAVAEVQDAFSTIDPGEDAQGLSADALRTALAGHADHLSSITTAVQSVAEAVNRRQALVAERDAAMPSDAEIAAAELKLVAAAAAAADAADADDPSAAAAANAEVRQATDNLADLIARKQAAQDRFDRGEQSAADTLDSGTSELGSAGPWPSAAAGSPLAAILANAQRMQQPGAAAMAAPTADSMPVSPMPGADADAALTAASALPAEDPGLALLGALLDRVDSTSSGHTSSPPTPPTNPDISPMFGDETQWTDAGMGQTHTSSDVPTQMPSLSGVVTGADVSGRPANPFLAAPPPTPTGATPAGGAMMPPMMPMGMGAGPGVAAGRGKAPETIIEPDPDVTGADIEARIATSGVIGRDSKRR